MTSCSVFQGPRSVRNDRVPDYYICMRCGARGEHSKTNCPMTGVGYTWTRAAPFCNVMFSLSIDATALFEPGDCSLYQEREQGEGLRMLRETWGHDARLAPQKVDAALNSFQTTATLHMVPRSFSLLSCSVFSSLVLLAATVQNSILPCESCPHP